MSKEEEETTTTTAHQSKQCSKRNVQEEEEALSVTKRGRFQEDYGQEEDDEEEEEEEAEEEEKQSSSFSSAAVGSGGAASTASSSSSSSSSSSERMKTLKYEGDDPMEIDMQEEPTVENLVKNLNWHPGMANKVAPILGPDGIGIYTFQDLYDWANSKSEETIASTKLAQPFFSRILSKLVGSEQEIGSGPAANIKKFVEAYNRGQGISNQPSVLGKRAITNPTYVEKLDFDELLENYVMQVDTSDLKLDVVDQEAQAQLLGPLNDPDQVWPIAESKDIDMRFYKPDAVPESSKRSLPNEFLLTIEYDYSIPRGSSKVIAVTGSGKTSTIFEFGGKHFVIYTQTLHEQREGTAFQGFRGLDADYCEMCRFIHHIPPVEPRVKIAIAKDRIATEYLARVLLLVRIVMDELKKKKKKDQSSVDHLPSMFLAAQVNGNGFVSSLLEELGGIMTVAKCDNLLRRAINWLSDQKLKGKPVLQISGEKRRLVVALDGVESPAASFLSTPQFSASTGNASTTRKEVEYHEENRSLFSLLREVLRSDFGSLAKWSVIVVGTIFSHRRSLFPTGSIGKGEESSDMITQSFFRTVTARDVRALLSRLKLPKDVNLEELLPDDMVSDQRSPDIGVSRRERNSSTSAGSQEKPSSSWVKLRHYLQRYVIGGRIRLLARATEVLKHVLEDHLKTNISPPTVTKEWTGEIFLEAFQLSVAQHRQYLVQTIQTNMQTATNATEQDFIRRSLAAVYLQAQLLGDDAEFLGGGLLTNKEIDFTNLGLCGYTTNGVEGTRVYKMTERFAMEAILEVCEDSSLHDDIFNNCFKAALQTLSEILHEHSRAAPFKDNLIGHVLLERLYYLSQDPNINSVADIPVVKEAVEKSDNAEFWENVKFNVKSPEIVLAESIGSGPAATSGYLSNSENVGHIVSPEPVCRPDGIVMLEYGANKESRCAIFVASAVYPKEVRKEKVMSQIRSTDPNLAYRRVNGSWNRKAETARKAWEDAGLHKLKNVVRIHFNLPVAGRVPEYKMSKLSWASRTKGVIVNVDQSNLYQFFTASESFEKLRDLLAMASRTNKDDWATHSGGQ